MLFLDPNTWHRQGRGRSFSFGVTRKELFLAIRDAIADNEERFGFAFGIADVPGPKRRFHGLNEIAEVPFDNFLEEFELGTSALWLRNFDLTPSLGDRRRTADGVLSANGLIRITDGLSISSNACASSVALVNKVHNVETNEEKEHTEYNEVFLSIRRCLNALKEMKVVSIEDPSKRFFYCSRDFENIFDDCEKRKGMMITSI